MHTHTHTQVRRYVEAATEEERFRLQASGEFHLGEFVNKFVRGYVRH
jgi:hypothetical protein